MIVKISFCMLIAYKVRPTHSPQSFLLLCLCIWTPVNIYQYKTSIFSSNSGTQPNGYGANFGSRVRCQICSTFAVETFEHVVFECEGITEARNVLLTDLLDAMPQAMRTSFTELNNEAKLVFILSGLGCDSYIKGWQDTYLKASRLIHCLFRERYNRYSGIDEPP